MNIRQKILVYFSVLSIGLIGIAFTLIYTLFSNYRTEEFQQRIKDKTVTTLKFLIEVQQIDYELLQTMDKYTINSLHREKTLIYDNEKKLIYASLDDTKIEFPDNILKRLSNLNQVIEFQEEDFDVIGIYFEFENKKYYGISKAYDKYGLSKLRYLRIVLIFNFILIAAIILVSSFLLSRQISQPIIKMATELKKVNLDSSDSFITVPNSRDEIEILAKRFNELMTRLNDSFSFQKYATQHISHELKTPIAQLVSNFEKMESESDLAKLREAMLSQKEGTKNLADIINTLLEISKLESGKKLDLDEIRIDELIYDVVDEIKLFHKNFQFGIYLNEGFEQEERLKIVGNKKLMRLAFMNMVVNCIHYSNDNKAKITIYNIDNNLAIEFTNNGEIITESEQQYIFQHFYRGENSKGKRGFGLGLVLTNKIISLHKGQITYLTPSNTENVFTIKLPLR